MKKGIKNIYFVGLGGIGMSALARYFNAQKYKIAGYDRVKTKLTNELETEGIQLTVLDELQEIPNDFKKKDCTLVVYTPAIPSENKILSFFKSNGFECIKRAAVLGALSAEFPTLAVAGTHGKTTVSTMIAHVLNSSGLKVNAFLGGVSRNFNSNLLLNDEANLLVVEADEYDRSFLQLHPQQAVITALSLDHMDIYQDERDITSAFDQFVSQISVEGKLFVHESVVHRLKGKSNCEWITYGGDETDVVVSNIHLQDGEFLFDIEYKGIKVKRLSSGLPGFHNIENAAVTFAVAIEQGVEPLAIKSAFEGFMGIHRRFDIHLKGDKLVYIDDYAHHPEEVNILLKSVKEMYPNRKVTAVFQPHLYSRTKDFAEDFALALSQADQLILMNIYPARELPIKGITSQWLADKIKSKNVKVVEDNSLLSYLKTIEMDILLTIGAGDISLMIPKIIEDFK